MRNDIRRKHYSRNTERTYLYWVRQYIYFHHKQHPELLNSSHIEQFLNHLALNKHTSGTTQSQALNAIVFLYREVLKKDVGDLDYLRNVRTFKNIPTVLSKDEVSQLFQQMQGTTKLMAALLYGAGLRVNECVTLRVQNIDLALKTITIRNAKGQKARVILIPQKLLKPLERHLLKRKQLHVDDLHQGWGYVELPFALAKKYKNAPTSFQWQYLFPSSSVRLYGDNRGIAVGIPRPGRFRKPYKERSNPWISTNGSPPIPYAIHSPPTYFSREPTSELFRS
jgi:integrase